MALVNGVNYSWPNVKIILFGVPVVGVVSIEYGVEQSKPNNYGAGVEPISRGYENKVYKGSIELYVDEWKAIIAAAPNRDPLEIPAFPIQVALGGSRVTADIDYLDACEFESNPMSTKQGDSKITVKINLAIGGIRR